MIKLNMEFPEGFFEEEEMCGHLVSRETKKVWAVQLDLMREFIRVCDKYNIRWHADAGTLLGAVRHKGFVPWDDDIDVTMMRDDFERFCNIGKDEFKAPYFLQTMDTTKEYICVVAKLRNVDASNELTGEKTLTYRLYGGITFDIVPIDAIPDSNKLLKQQTKIVHHYKKRAYFLRDITIGYKFIWRKHLVKLFGNYFLHLLYTGPLNGRADFLTPAKLFLDECKKYNGTETKRVCETGLYMEPRGIWERSWFDEIVYLPFEMFQIPVPRGYVELLDTFYGDWHTFVKRKSMHVEGRFENAEIEYIGGHVK